MQFCTHVIQLTIIQALCLSMARKYNHSPFILDISRLSKFIDTFLYGFYNFVLRSSGIFTKFICYLLKSNFMANLVFELSEILLDPNQVEESFDVFSISILDKRNSIFLIYFLIKNEFQRFDYFVFDDTEYLIVFDFLVDQEDNVHVFASILQIQ